MRVKEVALYFLNYHYSTESSFSSYLDPTPSLCSENKKDAYKTRLEWNRGQADNQRHSYVFSLNVTLAQQFVHFL